jgi:hypothetical protein
VAYTRKKLKAVRDLAHEVIELTVAVEAEANTQTRWDSTRQERVVAPQWPYYGGTRLTGTLRRRSSDLSQALIELRKP